MQPREIAQLEGKAGGGEEKKGKDTTGFGRWRKELHSFIISSGGRGTRYGCLSLQKKENAGPEEKREEESYCRREANHLFHE